jgi:hypothetical protein
MVDVTSQQRMLIPILLSLLLHHSIYCICTHLKFRLLSIMTEVLIHRYHCVVWWQSIYERTPFSLSLSLSLSLFISLSMPDDARVKAHPPSPKIHSLQSNAHVRVRVPYGTAPYKKMCLWTVALRYAARRFKYYFLFYVPLKNFSLIWRRHHCLWKAANFGPMFDAQGLWTGSDLYRATHAVTWGLGFPGLIRITSYDLQGDERDLLSCHTCCDMGARFFRSHPKDRPINRLLQLARWPFNRPLKLTRSRGCGGPILTRPPDPHGSPFSQMQV